MIDASKLPLQQEQFEYMAREFAKTHGPAEQSAIAGLIGRVYQLGYEHGERDGKAEQARIFVKNFKGGATDGT